MRSHERRAGVVVDVSTNRGPDKKALALGIAAALGILSLPLALEKIRGFKGAADSADGGASLGAQAYNAPAGQPADNKGFFDSLMEIPRSVIRFYSGLWAWVRGQ